MSDTADASPAELARRWFEELFNAGELGVADEILADDVRYDGPTSLSPTDVREPADVKEYVRTYRSAFPDLFYAIEATHDLADGILVEWSVSGTHEKRLYGIDSTGKAFAEDGLNVFRVEDGEIVHIRSEWDTLTMARELEMVPPVGERPD